jgi:hypothetical protein
LISSNVNEWLLFLLLFWLEFLVSCLSDLFDELMLYHDIITVISIQIVLSGHKHRLLNWLSLVFIYLKLAYRQFYDVLTPDALLARDFKFAIERLRKLFSDRYCEGMRSIRIK